MTENKPRGHQYRQPVSTMRAYLDSLDKAVSIAPPLDERPPTVLAALGPRMTALAGARTAGPFPYNVTPEHTRERVRSSAPRNGSASSKRCF